MKKINIFTVIIFFLIACNSKTNNRPKEVNDESTVYLQKGNLITKNTFDTLRTVLLKTIGEKGYAGAVKFCNVQALPITSVYASEGIAVSRVSDKNRNTGNGLQSMDKEQWQRYMEAAAKGDSLRANIITAENKVHYYKPILIQPMCLGCHGTAGKEIAGDLLPVLDSLYPGDKARGYKTGDLRGMWHIVFDKK